MRSENPTIMNFRQYFSTSSWWGKLLGAFFGYQIDGPVGAFIGVLIGNLFDRGLAEHFSDPYWPYHHEKQQLIKQHFFEATFTIMGYIAKSDGRVSEAEIDKAREVMSAMGLNRNQKKLAQHYFHLGKAPQFNLAQTLNQFEQFCKDRPELIKLFINTQYRAAMVENPNEKKIRALNTVFMRLGYASLHQQQQFYEDFGKYYHHRPESEEHDQQSGYYTYRPTQNHLAHAYALLDVTPQSSKQEVKRAYRRLISRHHPDKLISKGLPEKVIKEANEKTQKITKAYELICESRGW